MSPHQTQGDSVPMPRVGSLAELHDLMARADAVDDHRRISGRFLSVREHFAVEAHELRPLPAEPFDTRRCSTNRVDAKSRVCVRLCFYSRPATPARLDVMLEAGTVEVFDGGWQSPSMPGQSTRVRNAGAGPPTS